MKKKEVKFVGNWSHTIKKNMRRSIVWRNEGRRRKIGALNQVLNKDPKIQKCIICQCHWRATRGGEKNGGEEEREKAKQTEAPEKIWKSR